jgi:hypothetical protein
MVGTGQALFARPFGEGETLGKELKTGAHGRGREFGKMAIIPEAIPTEWQVGAVYQLVFSTPGAEIPRC